MTTAVEHINNAKNELALALAGLETAPAAPPATTPPAIVSLPGKPIIGVNGGSTSGYSEKVRSYGITSDRLAFAPESTSFEGRSISQSKALGFTNLAVQVGNINDSMPLSAVSVASNTASTLAQAKIAQAEGGVALLEFMNEPQFKGGVKNPLKYAELYLSAKKALKAYGITIPLGFTIFGDYHKESGWSQLASGAGWIGDVAKQFPELPKLVDCTVHHTYGRVGENLEENLGTKALEDELAEAAKYGFPAAFYVTEMGCQIGTTKSYDIAISEKEQAEVVKSVMAKTIELGSKGIWTYAVLDGAWSLKPEAYKAIASFL